VFILSNYISFLASCCGVRCDFRVNTLIYFVGASCFICVVCIYLRIMMLVLLSSNTMNVTSGAETALPNPEFTSVFSGLSVTQSPGFCAVFCGPLLIFSSFSSGHFSVYCSDNPFGIFKRSLRVWQLCVCICKVCHTGSQNKIRLFICLTRIITMRLVVVWFTQLHRHIIWHKLLYQHNKYMRYVHISYHSFY
jgi:hypothetical protein